MSDYLTPSEAARALGISSQYVRVLHNTGKLSAIRTPLGRLIPRDEVARLATERAAREVRDASNG